MRILAVLTTTLAACADPTGTEPPEETDPVELEGSETWSTEFDVEIFDPEFPSPKLPSFDTRGGARRLERMTLAFDHSLVGTVHLQNASAVDLADGDFTFDHYFNTLAQLGLATETNESPPFFGPGSFWWQVSEPLGPQGSGTDTFELSFDEHIAFEATYDPVETPTYLEAMTDAGDVTVVIGGFQEVFVSFDPSLEGSGVQLDWQVPSLRYSGTLTVTYDFVPEE